MKASERLRLEASLGNNVYNPWPMVALREAADLLDECERVIEQMCQVAEGVPMTATKSSKYFAEALVTLARLRAQERS